MPSCLGHGGGGAAVVAGEHDESQAECVEFADGFGGGGLDRVGDGEDARGLAVDGDKHRGLAFFLKFHRRGFERLQAGDLFIPQEIRFADHHRAPVDGADHAARRHRAEVLHGLESDVLVLRAPHDRGGERMLAALFQRGGEAQELLRIEAVGGQDIA